MPYRYRNGKRAQHAVLGSGSTVFGHHDCRKRGRHDQGGDPAALTVWTNSIPRNWSLAHCRSALIVEAGWLNTVLVRPRRLSRPSPRGHYGAADSVVSKRHQVDAERLRLVFHPCCLAVPMQRLARIARLQHVEQCVPELGRSRTLTARHRLIRPHGLRGSKYAPLSTRGAKGIRTAGPSHRMRRSFSRKGRFQKVGRGSRTVVPS